MYESPDAKSVQRAAAKVAGLYAHGARPTTEQELEARQRLAYERIRREVVRSVGAITLDPAHAAHLVALLVEGNDADAVDRFERAVREAAFSVPGLSNEDRARIGSALIQGGKR